MRSTLQGRWAGSKSGGPFLIYSRPSVKFLERTNTRRRPRSDTPVSDAFKSRDGFHVLGEGHEIEGIESRETHLAAGEQLLRIA